MLRLGETRAALSVVALFQIAGDDGTTGRLEGSERFHLDREKETAVLLRRCIL
jgi:hypothetical protein